MNWTLKVAWRYLVSKKTHNAVNIISIISMLGVMVTTAAIVCVLSVFNGFRGMIMGRLAMLDPEVAVTATVVVVTVVLAKKTNWSNPRLKKSGRGLKNLRPQYFYLLLQIGQCPSVDKEVLISIPSLLIEPCYFVKPCLNALSVIAVANFCGSARFVIHLASC